MANTPQETGRRRCRIPEHRRQIRYLQKWGTFLQSEMSQSWSRTRAAEAERDLLHMKLYRAKQDRFSRDGGFLLLGTLFWPALGLLIEIGKWATR